MAAEQATRGTRRGGIIRGTFSPRGIRAGQRFKAEEEVAGVAGFEPAVHCTKNSCLTTWLHPNGDALVTPVTGRFQARRCKKFTAFAIPLIPPAPSGSIQDLVGLDAPQMRLAGPAVITARRHLAPVGATVFEMRDHAQFETRHDHRALQGF